MHDYNLPLLVCFALIPRAPCFVAEHFLAVSHNVKNAVVSTCIGLGNALGLNETPVLAIGDMLWKCALHVIRPGTLTNALVLSIAIRFHLGQ